MALTHEDWQRVIDQRDTEARRACRRLNEGDLDRAKDHAAAWDEFDEKAARIAAELLKSDG